jgi:hypothetical protein
MRKKKAKLVTLNTHTKTWGRSLFIFFDSFSDMIDLISHAPLAL